MTMQAHYVGSIKEEQSVPSKCRLECFSWLNESLCSSVEQGAELQRGLRVSDRMWAGLALIWSNMGVAVTQLALLRSSLPSSIHLPPSRGQNLIVWLLLDIWAAAAGGRQLSATGSHTLTRPVKTSSWRSVSNYLLQCCSGTDHSAR